MFAKRPVRRSSASWLRRSSFQMPGSAGFELRRPPLGLSRILAERAGDDGEVPVGPQQHEGRRRIGHQERSPRDDLVGVPAAVAPEVEDREIPVVVALAGPHRRVHVVGVVAHVGPDPGPVDIGHADVPLRAVVTARLPRMGHRDHPGRTPVAAPPAVPREDAGVERGEPRPPDAGVRLVHAAGQDRGHRRLADPRGRRIPPCSPHVRTREVSRLRAVKDDVGDHAVVPLAGEQRLQLQPRAVDIEGGVAPGGEGAVPVPLVGVQPGRRHGVPAAVVAGPGSGGPGRRAAWSIP